VRSLVIPLFFRPRIAVSISQAETGACHAPGERGFIVSRCLNQAEPRQRADLRGNFGALVSTPRNGRAGKVLRWAQQDKCCPGRKYQQQAADLA
jgi:hypothetical protein